MSARARIIHGGFLVVGLCSIAILELGLSPALINVVATLQLILVCISYVFVMNYINNLADVNIMMKEKLMQQRHDVRSTVAGIKHLSSLIMNKVENDHLRCMHEMIVRSADELIVSCDTNK